MDIEIHDMVEYITCLIIYLIIAFLGGILQFRLVYIIHKDSKLNKTSAYILLAYAAACQGINCWAVFIMSCSGICYDSQICLTINKIFGAVYHGTWTAEYPTVFILALNRMIALVFPMSLDSLFNLTNTYKMKCFCVMYGVLNFSLLISPDVTIIWNPEKATFYFNDDTKLAKILILIDSYGVLFLVLVSCVLYLFTLFYIMKEIHLHGLRSVSAELPIFINFLGIFLATFLLLYLYHFPLMDSLLYSRIFNLFVLYRFALNNILVLMCNRTIRSSFFWSQLKIAQNPDTFNLRISR